MREKNGCGRAVLNSFVRSYGPRALERAYYLTRNHQDAEDLVQEAFNRLSDYWERYEPPRRIACLFVVILRNAFIDKKREAKRLVSLDAETGGDLGYHEILPHPEPDVLDQLIRKETASKVKDCLKKLRPSYRRVLTLADLEGKRYGVVADELDIPLGTMKSRLSRARESFRKNANGLRELALGGNE